MPLALKSHLANYTAGTLEYLQIFTKVTCFEMFFNQETEIEKPYVLTINLVKHHKIFINKPVPVFRDI